MRYLGRNALTKAFLLLTGGIVATLILGSIYFLFEPSLSMKRLLAIPLLAIAADIGMKFLTATDIVSRVVAFLSFFRVPSLFGYAFSIVAIIDVRRAKSVFEKIERLWSR